MVPLIQKFDVGPSIYNDLQSLEGIRQQGRVDSKSAIKAAAKEFEAFFMNMMLKSMRQASDVIGKDSIMGSSQEKMFVGMLDEQMSVELSQKGNLGIADLMVRNILGEDKLNLSQTNASLGDAGFPSRSRSIGYHQKINAKNHAENATVQALPNKKVGIEMEQNKPYISAKPQVKLEPTPIAKPVAAVELEPSKKSLFERASDFVEQLLPFAEKSAKKMNVDPRILLAQAALETGWGKFIMHDGKGTSSNNLFGIKGNNNWQGDQVKINTLEVEKGELVKQKESFRMYQSFEKSFDDYVEFLNANPRYQKALSVVDDLKNYTQSLQKAGYATDPDYASKIMRIFNQDVIQQAGDFNK